MVAIAFHALADVEKPEDISPVYVGLALLTVVTPWPVLLRHRYPVAVVLGAAALPVLFPYDAVTALVCLPALYTSRRIRWILAGTAAVVVSVTAAIARDLALPDSDQVFATSDGETLNAAGYVAVGVFALVVAVGAGLICRAIAADRRTAVVIDHAAQNAELHTARNAVMQDRLSRTEEREAIAREVHDTIAHSLSQIALQASALESGPGATPEVQEATARIRAAARRAGTELRGVLTTLRTGADGHTAVSFDDLARLLLDLRDQGTRINSTVFVSEGHTAGTTLTRACYRIVQESVTNAIKHAPGLPVDIVLRGAPATGVTITVTNPLPDDAAAPPAVTGTGSGIPGMTERARLASGSLTAGPARRQFQVEAHLPWTGPSADEP
ncbi:histidine kinase [Myceligenerans crystallogenes]|uniref:histidine kinase n=2 Tax=Myceligenerans crystallogenes TaxID=316335 RepID=A0ABN2NJS4_9MICO